MIQLKQLILFTGIAGIIFSSLHYYIYSRSIYYFNLNNISQTILASGLAISCLFLVFSLLLLFATPLRGMLPKNIMPFFSKSIYLWLGFTAILSLVILLTDIFRISLNFLINSKLLNSNLDISLYNNNFFSITIIITTFFLIIYSLYNANSRVKIKEITVKLQKLPKDLNKFKIVQLTDLHIGNFLKGSWLKEVVKSVNSLEADVIVITGDLVDGSVKDLSRYIKELHHLKSKQGVYFVTGNHDYYSGADQWVDYLKSIGIIVLRNERVKIYHNNKSAFELAGIEDFHSYKFGNKSDIKKALLKRDINLPLILLAHQPASVEEASLMDVDLQLSGHTHGGQIWPFHYLVKIQQPFISGLHFYKNTNTQIYISRGTGYWGPPIRLGAPAEITKIILEPN